MPEQVNYAPCATGFTVLCRNTVCCPPYALAGSVQNAPKSACIFADIFFCGFINAAAEEETGL